MNIYSFHLFMFFGGGTQSRKKKKKEKKQELHFCVEMINVKLRVLIMFT